MTKYHWTPFSIKDGYTHAQAGDWFDQRGFHGQEVNLSTRVRVVCLDGLDEAGLKSLLALPDCPVVLGGRCSLGVSAGEQGIREADWL